MQKLEQSRAERFREKQKERNDRSKEWQAIIGQNLSLVICLMIPVLLVSTIFTETSFPKLCQALATNAVMTIILFVYGERVTIGMGAQAGKLDDEYIEAQRVFREKKDAIKRRGVMEMDLFCEWQIDEELIRSKKKMCRTLHIRYDDYVANMQGLSNEQLVQRYGKVKAREISLINAIKPIELSPDIILGEGGDRDRRGVPINAEEYIKKETYGKVGLLKSVVTVVFTVGIDFAAVGNVSWAMIIYTAYKLIALLIRMKKGYDKGAAAYNKIEVQHLNSRSEYIDLYSEFLDTPRLYEKVRKEYGGDELLELGMDEG